MPEHTGSGIDFEGLSDRVAGDSSFVEELVGLFLTDVPAKIADLTQAIDTLDAARVEKLAHSLKGTSATVKAGAFEAVALELELAAKAGETQKWQSLANQLRDEFVHIERQAGERNIEPRNPDSAVFGP